MTANESPRTITVFGISGQTGQAIATAARQRGWRVRGFLRPGSQFSTADEHIQLYRGHFNQPDVVAAAIAGSDAVVCVLGPRAPFTDVFCAQATRVIVDACKRQRCSRFVCQTGAMIGKGGNRSWAMCAMSRLFAKQQPLVAQDRVEQEAVVMNSELNWTLVKPPRLTTSEKSGTVHAGSAVHVGLLSSISLASLAAFILNEIETPAFAQQRIYLKQ